MQTKTKLKSLHLFYWTWLLRIPHTSVIKSWLKHNSLCVWMYLSKPLVLIFSTLLYSLLLTVFSPFLIPLYSHSHCTWLCCIWQSQWHHEVFFQPTVSNTGVWILVHPISVSFSKIFFRVYVGPTYYPTQTKAQITQVLLVQWSWWDEYRWWCGLSESIKLPKCALSTIYTTTNWHNYDF